MMLFTAAGRQSGVFHKHGCCGGGGGRLWVVIPVGDERCKMKGRGRGEEAKTGAPGSSGGAGDRDVLRWTDGPLGPFSIGRSKLAKTEHIKATQILRSLDSL